LGSGDDRTGVEGKVNDLRGVLGIEKNDVCAAEGSDYRGASPFRRWTFLGVSESERENVFAFERGEVSVSGTENRL
jgi:hypothetical protein